MKLKALIVLLALAGSANGTELVLHGLSVHSNKQDWMTYNERNTGAGVRVADGRLAYQVGAYHNTQDRVSTYAVVDWLPAQAGRFSAGLFGGAATGYAVRYSDGKRDDFPIVPVAGVTARVQAGNLALALRGVPQVSKYSSGVVSLELSWRIR